jgi:hypothetical protein
MVFSVIALFVGTRSHEPVLSQGRSLSIFCMFNLLSPLFYFPCTPYLNLGRIFSKIVLVAEESFVMIVDILTTS